MRSLKVVFKEEVRDGKRGVSSSIEGHCDAEFFLDAMWEMGRIFTDNFVEISGLAEESEEE